MRHISAIAGAYDLKRSYQKNMAIGFGVSGMMHVTVLISLVLFVFQARDISIPSAGPTFPDTIFIAPPSLANPVIPDRIKTIERITIPNFENLKAVPDNQASIETDIPDQNQLGTLALDIPIGDLGKGIVIDVEKVIENLIPPPDAPSFYDDPPVLVSQVTPKYPDLAERAGIEGKVWIKAFIDKEGRVLDVIIINANPADMGFEEAAIESARQAVWKPAISNGLPVGVWITYKVEFMQK